MNSLVQNKIDHLVGISVGVYCRQRYLQNRHKDLRHEALTKHNTRILRKN